MNAVSNSPSSSQVFFSINRLLRFLSNRVLISQLTIVGISVAAICFLEVPIKNAALVVSTTALQAALGVLLICLVFRNCRATILLLLGPGVILGGAVSFGIFQLVGRGIPGAIAVLLSGGIAALKLSISRRWQPLIHDRISMAWHLVGMTALILASEFPEALLAAVVSLCASLAAESIDAFGPKARRIKLALNGLAITTIVCLGLLKQNYWWLVTDDYSFFEMLTRHLVVSGPFENWGVGNWSRYHWLSYGWSGLINILSGNPEAYLTLTRVMPSLYSVSLSSSLLLLSASLQPTVRKPTKIALPVWAVLAIHRLDWSGLSTAGAYAVIAASCSVAALGHTSQERNPRRIYFYVVFLAIASLTKLSSIFAIALFALFVEASTFFRPSHFRRHIIYVIGVTGVASMSIFLVLPHFLEATGQFRIENLNPALGQLSESSFSFAVFTLTTVALPTIIPGLLVLGKTLSNRGTSWRSRCPLNLASLLPLAFLAIVFDLRIHGNADNHRYFSGPLYFAASLSLLQLMLGESVNLRARLNTLQVTIVCSGLILAGLIWTRRGFSSSLWTLVGGKVLGWSTVEVDLALFFLSSRPLVGAMLVTLILFAYYLWASRPNSLALLCGSVVVSLVILPMLMELGSAQRELLRQRTNEEVERNLGSSEIRSVAAWIHDNSRTHDLIATNYLYHYKTGRPLSDYSLAAWSKREFLVLGPSFLPNFEDNRDSVDLCISFGEAPTPDAAENLRSRGVAWFVVDKWSSAYPDWGNSWPSAYQNSRFIVIDISGL